MKIGILPNYNNNKRPFLNTLNFINNYPYRILKNGAIPFGVLFPNGIFNENLLKQYQGFLIPGGNNIYLYHILTIHYAIKNNKPLLGICLGMQAIGLYNYITHYLKKRNLSINYLSISQTFEGLMALLETEYSQEQNTCLLKVPRCPGLAGLVVG